MAHPVKDELKRILKEIHGIEAGLLIGGIRKRDREQINQDLAGGKIKVLVCTGQLIGEGYDLPALETLFLAMPVKFSGRLIQYVGRISRDLEYFSKNQHGGSPPQSKL